MGLKTLIIQWIIIHCDLMSFLGMRWEDREKGIFSLYWKHQSSRICRENAAESESMYDYCNAWARHKNNNKCRQPRDLKAAFRNALEKKLELERLKHLDTKERIFWRIKDFANVENNYSSTKTKLKKRKGPTNREKKSFSKSDQNGDEFPVNFGASTSKAIEDSGNFDESTSTPINDVPIERKKTRKPPIKGPKKATVKSEKSLDNEEVEPIPFESTVNVFPTPHDEVKTLDSLPPFGSLKRNDDGFWGDSSNPSSSKTIHDQRKDEDLWTPQIFGSPVDRWTPPQLSSDLMDVSPTEMMDLLIPNPNISYSFQPTPPQQTSDIIFDNFTGADLMNLDKIINGREPTILKYSFPFQPNEVPTNLQHHQKITYAHQIPATSSHCSVSDYISPTKIFKFQSNNSVIDTRTRPVNAFIFDQKQYFYDQVVPEHFETFHTNHQMIDTSNIFISDSLPYSQPAMDNHEQIHAEMCHQQVNTSYPSIGLFRFDEQTSHDDSGISDMDDFLECANKLLDDIDSKSDTQCHPML